MPRCRRAMQTRLHCIDTRTSGKIDTDAADSDAVDPDAVGEKDAASPAQTKQQMMLDHNLFKGLCVGKDEQWFPLGDMCVDVIALADANVLLMPAVIGRYVLQLELNLPEWLNHLSVKRRFADMKRRVCACICRAGSFESLKESALAILWCT